MGCVGWYGMMCDGVGWCGMVWNGLGWCGMMWDYAHSLSLGSEESSAVQHICQDHGEWRRPEVDEGHMELNPVIQSIDSRSIGQMYE